MAFDSTEFHRLYQEAESGLDLADTQQAIQRALNLLDRERDLLPAQKNRYLQRGEEAIARIAQRRTDARELARALRAWARRGLGAEQYAAADRWLRDLTDVHQEELHQDLLNTFTDLVHRLVKEKIPVPVAERPELLDGWIERLLQWSAAPVDAALLKDVRQLWGAWPEKRLNMAIGITAVNITRADLFSRSSPDPLWVLGLATGVARTLHALPMDDGARSEALGRLTPSVERARQRADLPADQLMKACLDLHERQVEEVAGRRQRFGQVESYVLQVNIFRARRLLATDTLSEDARDELKARLSALEEAFDPLRYMSSTSVYKRSFATQVERLAQDVDSVLDFAGFRERMKRLEGAARRAKDQGREGVDQLKIPHLRRVQEGVASVRVALQARQDRPRAMLTALLGAEVQVAEIAQRPLVTRNAVMRAHESLRQLRLWCQHLAKGGEAGRLPDVDSGEIGEALSRVEAQVARCNEIWASIDERYESYVRGLREDIERFTSSIPAIEDVRAASEELKGLKGVISVGESPLRRRDAEQMAALLQAAERRLNERINDVGAVDARIGRQEQVITRAARNLRRVGSFDDLDEDARLLAFWVDLGRFASAAVKRGFKERIDQLFRRIRGLRRAREEYLKERAANAHKLAEELRELIQDACEQAQTDPGAPSAWRCLVEASRELQEAHLLRGAPEFAQLKAELDQGFQHVRAERARFAQQAAIAYAQYMQTISNVLMDLERTEPPPGRGDALDAIEVVKPLRASLRSEARLLRDHRQEIFENLELVSQAIEEIFQQDDVRRQTHQEELEKEIDTLGGHAGTLTSGKEIGDLIERHRHLHESLRRNRLSIGGRRRCLEKLEWVWAQIMEAKARVVQPRLDPTRLDEWLDRLEQQGRFNWIRGVPSIA